MTAFDAWVDGTPIVPAFLVNSGLQLQSTRVFLGEVQDFKGGVQVLDR
jgi:hypothetical protein